MAYGNYGFYDAENAAEGQKRAQQQAEREAEMERRRQDQLAYERARQAFQEQIIAQEQARRQAETANQYQLGLDSNNVQRQLSKDQWTAKQNMTGMTVGGMKDMYNQFSGMFGGDQSSQTTLKDSDGNVIGGSFAHSSSQKPSRPPIQKGGGMFSPLRRSLLG